MAKPKAVNWTLIDDPMMYTIVDDLLKKYHGGKNNIQEIHCLLMWRDNVKMDQDGYVWLADIAKSTDKMRELRPHDMIIGINRDAWSILDHQQKNVIIDSQLERIAICLDKEECEKEDDRSRKIYRLRRTEVIDDATMNRRHALTLGRVQDYVSDKFTTAGAEKGSYVDQVLNGNEDNNSDNEKEGDADAGQEENLQGEAKESLTE